MNNAYEYIINKARQRNCTRREGGRREGREETGITEMIYRRKSMCKIFIQEKEMQTINKSNVL